MYCFKGKKALGSCGASGARLGIHRLYEVGIVGGSLDSVYTLFAEVTVAMAAERSGISFGMADTAVSLPSAEGAATLEYKRSISLRVYKCRYSRRGLRMLNQQGRKLQLGNHGELWVCASYIAFPVWVLSGVGSYNSISKRY